MIKAIEWWRFRIHVQQAAKLQVGVRLAQVPAPPTVMAGAGATAFRPELELSGELVPSPKDKPESTASKSQHQRPSTSARVRARPVHWAVAGLGALCLKVQSSD